MVKQQGLYFFQGRLAYWAIDVIALRKYIEYPLIVKLKIRIKICTVLLFLEDWHVFRCKKV